MIDLNRLLSVVPRLRQRMAAGVLVERGLAVLLALLAVALLAASVQAVRERAAARQLGQTYEQLTGTRPSALAAQLAHREQMVKRMSAHRLIAPPPPQLTGVLGDQALFNNGMVVKAGQSVGDMTIQAVGPNWVEVQSNGETQKLWVFQPSNFR